MGKFGVIFSTTKPLKTKKGLEKKHIQTELTIYQGKLSL